MPSFPLLFSLRKAWAIVALNALLGKFVRKVFSKTHKASSALTGFDLQKHVVS